MFFCDIVKVLKFKDYEKDKQITDKSHTKMQDRDKDRVRELRGIQTSSTANAQTLHTPEPIAPSYIDNSIYQSVISAQKKR